MDTKKFLEDFITLFDDEPADAITIKTAFRDIEGWSSFTALTFMALMDEKYNVKISGEDIQNSKTIEDLLNKTLLKM